MTSATVTGLPARVIFVLSVTLNTLFATFFVLGSTTATPVRGLAGAAARLRSAYLAVFNAITVPLCVTSIDRVVPSVMTALCTGLALVPVALGAGEPGSEIQAPTARVIIFGLITSTALNMVVVPAAYYALHRRGASLP